MERERERESGISVLSAQLDNDIQTHIYMCVCVCVWMTIYTLSYQKLSTLVKELMAVTCVMQSSSNNLNSLVSDNAKCKQMKVNTYVL